MLFPNMKRKPNKLSTLLNGKNLTKSFLQNRIRKNTLCSKFPNPERDPKNNSDNFDSNSILQKGLKSLENPVLRGSFSLVLNEKQLDFLDKIAKTAFLEIIKYGCFEITKESPDLYTIHCTTDKGKIQNQRPGVYVIMNVRNGKCIVGQTKNLKKRMNQYTSRGSKISSQFTQINKNFYLAVQQEIQKGLEYSQVFQRFIIYTWVDENKKALDIENSIDLQNEMSYLEHRLLLAFFECGRNYNINDTFPKLGESPKTLSFLTTESLEIQNTEKKVFRQKGPNVAKPFKVGNLYFLTKNDYSLYRNSLGSEQRKQFKAVPALRKQLERNAENLQADVRYLHPIEIRTIHEKNLFIRLKKKD